jgi:23S rRNA pseudouridine2457 synthase
MENHYYIVNKPYGMLSQFIGGKNALQLSNLNYNFPEGIHAIGRLDKQSEGLLLLTTDKKITKLIFQSKEPHQRIYHVKVDKKVSQETLEKLRSGIQIRIRGGAYWTTSPCIVEIIEAPANLLVVNERLNHNGLATWLRITLTEGKYHQIRKMTASVGHKCKRLIRVAIEDLQLNNIASSEVLEISEAVFYKQLKLKKIEKGEVL